MSGGKELAKKIILFELVIVIYIVLTSTIINYQSEAKVSSIIVDSVIDWSTKSFNSYSSVITREKTNLGEVDPALSERLSGTVLLQVESRGEAWYVYPEDKKKYYLGSADNIYNILKDLGKELGNDALVDYQYFNKEFPADLSGYVVWDSDIKGEAYYVKPEDKLGYFFSDPQMALRVMTEQGLGITNKDLRKIELGVLE